MSRATHALLVGVGRYRTVPSLPEAVRNDVLDMATLLRDRGLPPTSVTVLLDDQVTAASMRAAFAEVAAALAPDDLFIFYFSGHGERARIGTRERSWLLPHDAALANLAASAISANEIAGLLAALPPGCQVLLIDACHAGGIGAKTAVASPKGFAKSAIDTFGLGAGRAILTSSKDDEQSGIIAGDRNSIFTTALLEAFDGATFDRGEGVIRVFDVFEYVATVVPQRAAQHPIFHADSLDGNFAIMRRHATPRPGSSTVDELVTVFAPLYPTGPTHEGLWSRAGGDVSRLVLSGPGLAQWHAALTKVTLGGGGVTLAQLARTARADYPDNPALASL